jgi:hypothetical protein
MNHRFAPISSQAITHIRRAAILPDNCAVNRFARRPLPNNDCFPLISDSNRGNIGFRELRRRQRLAHYVALARPDFLGVMFDPSRLRIMLFKLVVP